MKKILSLILLIAILFWNISSIFAEYDEKSYYASEAISSLNELNKTTQWKKLAKLSDEVISKYWKNEKALKELIYKTSSIDTNVYSSTIISSFLSYIDAKANLSLILIKDAKITDITSPSVSNAGKELVNEKILELQHHILNNFEEKIKKISEEFEKNMNVKESWDMIINMEANISKDESFKTDIELKNYDVYTNWFDSEFKSNLNVLFETLTKETNNDIRLQFEWLLEMITKEWNIYFLLRDANILSSKNVEQAKEIFEKIKDLAIKNQYLKIEDQSSQMLFDIMKAFDYNTIINDVRETLKQPLIEAYKKEWDKYYLRPTKYSCDTFKKTISKFDPLYWDSCSTAQYKTMLEDFINIWDFYIILDENTTTIWYEWEVWGEVEKNKWHITFDNRQVLEYSYILTPNQSYYPEEGFYINYKDGIIKWGLTLSSSKYDYSTWEYLDTMIYYTLDWIVSPNWEVTNLSLNYRFNHEKTGDYIKWKLEKTWRNFSINHQGDFFAYDLRIEWNGALDDYGMLSDMKFDLKVVDEVLDTSLLDINYKITNYVIDWNLNFYINSESVFKINTNGNWSKDVVNIYNTFELSENFINLFTLGSESNNISWIFNINSNTSNNKWDVYMIIEVKSNDNLLFKFLIDNKSYRDYNYKKQINTPKEEESVDFMKEFLWVDISNYLYYSY